VGRWRDINVRFALCEDKLNIEHVAFCGGFDIVGFLAKLSAVDIVETVGVDLTMQVEAVRRTMLESVKVKTNSL
jgi:hypothetical protein